MNSLRLSSFLSAFLVLLFHSSSFAFSSNTNGFSASLGNFSGSKVNPSTIKISIGGKDVTDTMKMAASTTFYDGFDFNVTLKEPLKAQAGLEVKLEGRTLDGKDFESQVSSWLLSRVH